MATFTATIGGLDCFLSHDDWDWGIWEGTPEDYAPVAFLMSYQGHPSFFKALVLEHFGEVALSAINGTPA